MLLLLLFLLLLLLLLYGFADQQYFLWSSRSMYITLSVICNLVRSSAEFASGIRKRAGIRHLRLGI